MSFQFHGTMRVKSCQSSCHWFQLVITCRNWMSLKISFNACFPFFLSQILLFWLKGFGKAWSDLSHFWWRFFSGLRKLYLYTCRRTNCLSITQHLKWGNKWWKILLLLKHQMSPSLIWKQFAKSHFYCFPSFIHKKLVRPMSDKSPKRVFCFVFCFAAIKVKLGTGVSQCPIPSSPAGCPVPTLRLLLCHNIVNRKSVWVILWLRNTYCFLLYLK